MLYNMFLQSSFSFARTVQPNQFAEKQKKPIPIMSVIIVCLFSLFIAVTYPIIFISVL